MKIPDYILNRRTYKLKKSPPLKYIKHYSNLLLIFFMDNCFSGKPYLSMEEHNFKTSTRSEIIVTFKTVQNALRDAHIFSKFVFK